MSEQHEEAGSPPQPEEPGEPGYYCNAKTRDGSPCSKRAGQGTSHPGEGRCKNHGGVSGTLKHGLYSKLSRYDFGNRISELRNDSRLTNVREHLAIQVATVERFLEELAEKDTIDADDAKTLVRLGDLISRGVHRLTKIEGDNALDPQEAQILIQQVVHIVRDVAGPEASEEVGKKLLEVEPEKIESGVEDATPA